MNEKKVFISYLLILYLSVSNGQSDTPVIISASQTGQNSVKIEWSVMNDSQADFSRYRILYTKDNWNTHAEWPAQIMILDSDVSSAAYKTLNTSSYFECFNECLNDLDCIFAARISQFNDNCQLKKEINGNASSSSDSAYISITSYANATEITNIPHNEKYNFKVAVYNKQSQAWSNFSDSSYDVDMRIVLNLSYRRTNLTNGIVKWTQNGYTISRFNIKVTLNGTSHDEVPNTDSLVTYKLEPNYYSDNDFSNFTLYENITECQEACFMNNDCVQFVYFNSDYKSDNGTIIAPKNSCFLKNKIDFTTAVFPRRESTAMSIKSDLNEFALNNLAVNSNYRIQVECLTVYGSKCSKFEVVYNMTDLKPNIKQMVLYSTFAINMTWVMPEPLNYTRYAFFYSTNQTSQRVYILTQSETDFIDTTNQTINSIDIYKCFEFCFNQSTCLAYSYNYITLQCILKYKISATTPCDTSSTYCGIIPPYTNQISIPYNYANTQYAYSLYVQTADGYNGVASDSVRFTFMCEFDVEQIDEFIIHRYGRLRCLYYSDLTSYINWYKDNDLFNATDYDADLSTDETFVNFKNITRKAAGFYQCEVVFKTGQRIFSNNIIRVRINETIPARPTIHSVYPMAYPDGEGILLRWNADVEELPVTCITLRSRNPNNFNQDSFHQCTDTLRSGVFMLEKKFDCETVFSIQVENEVGPSDFSNEYTYGKEYCKPENLPNESNYYTAFVTITVMFVIVSVSIIIFLSIMVIRYRRGLPRNSELTKIINNDF